MEDWLAPLQQGRPEVAWERFLTRYRRLIFASIRHYTRDYDDGMDLFAHVCGKLREDDMRRLRRRAEEANPRAQLSTWLVAVVRHLAVDWFRHRDGRQRLSALAQSLTPRGRRIFELVFLERRSHAEAYELLRGAEPGLTLHDFHAELRGTYAALSDGRRGRLLRELVPAPPPPPDADAGAPAEAAERRQRLEAVLTRLSPDDRVAVELYVVEGLPAEQVARVLALPNAKAVYNRVYRALTELRRLLEQAGIRRGDL
jgi:DNA-directed RNA polymerase specialized sigma24 family protein